MIKYLKFARYCFDTKQILVKCKSLNLSYILKNQKLVNNFSTSFQLLNKMPRYEYPKVRRDESIVDDFHGDEVLKCIFRNYFF